MTNALIVAWTLAITGFISSLIIKTIGDRQDRKERQAKRH